MQEIKKDGILYAIAIEFKNLENGVKWYTSDEDTLQVCTRKYKGAKGKALKNHWHEKVSREVVQTQECMILIEGRMSARIYDMKQVLFKTIDMRPGDAMVFLCGGHGYSIHSDRCIAFELKAAKFVRDLVEITNEDKRI